MRIGASILIVCLAVSSNRLLAQECKRDLQRIVIPQETYARIDPAAFRGNNRLFVYLPDIKTPVFGRGWRTFQLSIVEGIYGPPFPRERGSLGESTFERLRASRSPPSDQARDEVSSPPTQSTFPAFPFL